MCAICTNIRNNVSKQKPRGIRSGDEDFITYHLSRGSEDGRFSLNKDQSGNYGENEFSDPEGKVVWHHVMFSTILWSVWPTHLKELYPCYHWNVLPQVILLEDTENLNIISSHLFPCVSLVCHALWVLALFSDWFGSYVTVNSWSDYMFLIHTQRDEDGKVTIKLMSRIPEFPLIGPK